VSAGAIPGKIPQHSSLQFHNMTIQYLYLQLLHTHWARERSMPTSRITREDFLRDRQGRTFTDVLSAPGAPIDALLLFFSDEARQQRMEDSEIHHDRPALAGVIRELESQPQIDAFLSEIHRQESKRFRQATGVVVRMIMERRGWKKTGKKGSLGVRAKSDRAHPSHNTGGLAFWFIRAERYEKKDGMPFRSVRERRRRFPGSKQRPTRSRSSRQTPQRGKADNTRSVTTRQS
jgi:hypothetical protein